MAIQLTEDIRSITDLKRKTREILDQVKQTGRPVILTVNGRADAVILDVHAYEKHLQAGNMAKLLTTAEEEAATGRSRPIRSFLRKFKHARKISR